MSDHNVIYTSTGAGLVTLATYALGPILGEYVFIAVFGLLGTLIALSDSNQPTLWQSIVFLVKGLLFSVVFTGLFTSVIVRYLPSSWGLTPYALMGGVSFMIGWSSDRMAIVKSAAVAFVTSWLKLDKSGTDK